MQVKNSSAESDIKWTLCGKKFWTGCNQDSNIVAMTTGQEKMEENLSCIAYSSFVVALTTRTKKKRTSYVCS